MKLRARTDDLSWREVEDEAIILDLATQRYLSLNASGLEVWRALQDDGATPDELTARLTDRFSVDREVAARDVSAFVALLRERDLLA